MGSYAAELSQLEERLPSIIVPVLITWGAADRFVLPSNAERLLELLPNAELTIFDGAGHFSHEDADQAWLDRLTTFATAHHSHPRARTDAE